MTTAAAQITGTAVLEPFYYLKISGLPYYFFSTIDPSSTSYGSDAWPAPSGYPAAWNKRGLLLPDDSVDSKVPDLIGGICTPERIRLKLLDFPDPVNIGYNYFARLFAPGRVLTDSTSKIATLTASVTPATTSIQVRGSTLFTDDTDAYIGAETVGITNIVNNGSSLQTLTVTRNKYPCFVDGSNTFPPTPYHRVDKFDINAASASAINTPPVSSDIITVYGRTAALFMGHMKPGGTPEPETSSACLMIGRIIGVGQSDDGTHYEINLTSVAEDLDKGLVAPALAQAEIMPGFYLGGLDGSTSNWLRFEIVRSTGTVYKVIIGAPPDSVRYSGTELVNAINNYMATQGVTDIKLGVLDVGDGPRFVFDCFNTTRFTVRTSGYVQTGKNDVRSYQASLLYLLGFDPKESVFESNKGTDASTGFQQLAASRQVAKVVIPTQSIPTNGVLINLAERGTADTFFIDQGDLAGSGFARFGNKQVVQVISRDLTNNRLYMGTSFLSSKDPADEVNEPFYYVPHNGDAFVEQVLVSHEGPRTRTIARLLCSTTAETVDDFNVYPDGVGMGWNDIVKKEDWQASHIDGSGNISGIFIVDRKSTFGEFFRPIARLRGWFLMWDPAISRFRLRMMARPSKESADQSVTSSSTFVFSESNRADLRRSSMQTDRSSVRTSWTLKLGYDPFDGDFVAQSITVNDVISRSFYPNGLRTEEIRDKTMSETSLASGAVIAELGEDLTARSNLYRFPWQCLRRSVNKTGLMLSPGTFHQIVDNTLVNPFTGASGITSADAIYAFLGGVSKQYSTGNCRVELYVFATSSNTETGPWSPTALVDFDAAGQGYSSSTKILTLLSHFTNQSGKYDGIDFAVGDKVRVCARDWSVVGPSSQNDTVAAISATGQTMTMTTGLSSLGTSTESVVMLRQYADGTVSRQSGTGKVTWQGDATSVLVDGVGRIMKWQ